jgi:hypothetical protein
LGRRGFLVWQRDRDQVCFRQLERLPGQVASAVPEEAPESNWVVMSALVRCPALPPPGLVL